MNMPFTVAAASNVSATLKPELGACRYIRTARPAAMTATTMSQLSAPTPLNTSRGGGPQNLGVGRRRGGQTRGIAAAAVTAASASAAVRGRDGGAGVLRRAFRLAHQVTALSDRVVLRFLTGSMPTHSKGPLAAAASAGSGSDRRL